MADYEEEPQFDAPLLYKLVAYLRGKQAPKWSASDYAMGLTSAPQRGLGALRRSSAKFIGRQEVPPPGTGFNMYNLGEDIADETGKVLHPRGSTVGEDTLQKYGVPYEQQTTILPGTPQAIPDDALQQVIDRFKGRPAVTEQGGFQKLMTSGPKTPSGPGSLSGIGEAQRPWTEIYKNTETGGGKYTPQSYKSPTEQVLDEATDPDALLKKLLAQFGGSYTGTSGM
jgi:hypothetical protein